MATTIIGIDPGKSGGIAVIRPDDIPPFANKMPETERDIYDFIWSCNNGGNKSRIYVERVNAGPKMGSSAAFKFGQNVGAIRMACLAVGAPVEYVTPQKWQRELGLIVSGRGLGQNDTAKKNRNKARAQELFPELKITHHIADALLIAEFGRRQLNGTP